MLLQPLVIIWSVNLEIDLLFGLFSSGGLCISLPLLTLLVFLSSAGGTPDLPCPLGSPHAVLVGNGNSNINSMPTVPPSPAPRSELPTQLTAPAMTGIPGEDNCGTLEISAPPSRNKRFPSTAESIPQTDGASPTNLAHLPNRSMALEPNYDTWFQGASQVRGDTDKQLQQAQLSAQDAMATATAALAQSHVTWARIQSQNPSEIGNAREAQIASVAATVAAAASVAKAAVEAAKAIVDASSEAYMQAGAGQAGAAFQASTGGGVLPPQLEFGNTLQPPHVNFLSHTTQSKHAHAHITVV